MRKLCLWIVCVWILFSVCGCTDHDNQEFANYESQIKHLESEVEQLRNENEQLKKQLQTGDRS